LESSWFFFGIIYLLGVVAQREARKIGKLKRNVFSDVYNTEDVAMPLHEFINHPVAHELIHNGVTFQVFKPPNQKCSDPHQFIEGPYIFLVVGTISADMYSPGSWPKCSLLSQVHLEFNTLCYYILFSQSDT
jgi:hypothetical protein